MADGYQTQTQEEGGAKSEAQSVLREFCRTEGLSMADISGAEVSKRNKQARVKAVIAARRATKASYEQLGVLLDECPTALQRSVRNSLELPHW